LSTFAVEDGHPEEALAEENSLGMVPESPMPEVWEESFGLIKPVVDCTIVLGFAAESSSAVFRVFEWVGHGYTS
jgi:hypothetical protein